MLAYNDYECRDSCNLSGSPTDGTEAHETTPKAPFQLMAYDKQLAIGRENELINRNEGDNRRLANTTGDWRTQQAIGEHNRRLGDTTGD